MTRDELWQTVRFIAFGTFVAIAVGTIAVAIAHALFGGLYT